MTPWLQRLHSSSVVKQKLWKLTWLMTQTSHVMGKNLSRMRTSTVQALPWQILTASAKQLNGKELSFNNIRDADFRQSVSSVTSKDRPNRCGFETHEPMWNWTSWHIWNCLGLRLSESDPASVSFMELFQLWGGCCDWEDARRFPRSSSHQVIRWSVSYFD